MDSVEENAGRERKLTGATKTARTARNGGFARRSPVAVFCANREEQRQGEKKMGRGEKARAWGAIQLEAEARGGENVGAGASAWAVSNRGRGSGWRFGGMDEPDGWAPPVSRQRERRGMEGEAAGLWPRKGARGTVLGQNGRKEGGGERKLFPFQRKSQIHLFLKEPNFGCYKP